MKLAARSIRDEGHEGSDCVGTLHVAHWVPFEHNHLGFFTIYNGSFEKYIQDFAEKLSPVFDAVFPHVVGAPPTPVAKNAEMFYQWGLDNNYPPIGFYSAYPASRCRTSGRSWPIASLSLPRPDTTGPPCSRTKNEAAFTLG